MRSGSSSPTRAIRSAPTASTASTPIKHAAKEAIKGTPLEGSKIYLGGTASAFKDMQEGNNYDLLIAGIPALALIFIIMLIITRSLVAAAVIVGTVVLSLGASFGLSVLVWQHILGIELQFMVMAMAVIILLAVGADYNLLLVARLKEEIHAGVNTGIIRAMGGSGSVVTAAGLVFAFTMMSMVGQRADGGRSGRHDDRTGPAVRHLGDPRVHDAVDRGAAGPVVLVAAEWCAPGPCLCRGRNRRNNSSNVSRAVWPYRLWRWLFRPGADPRGGGCSRKASERRHAREIAQPVLGQQHQRHARKDDQRTGGGRPGAASPRRARPTTAAGDARAATAARTSRP